MSESQKIIKECFESVRNTFEDDTEQTIKQMESLRQLNTGTTLKYIKKEEDFKTLTRKAEHIEAMGNELKEYNEMINVMESRLGFIEQLIDELDRYTLGDLNSRSQ